MSTHLDSFKLGNVAITFIAEDALLVAAHAPFPGTARLQKQGDRVIWSPAPPA